jgi:hypothetical protein
MNNRQRKSIKQSVSLTQETIDLLNSVSRYWNLCNSGTLRQLIIKAAQEIGLKTR